MDAPSPVGRRGRDREAAILGATLELVAEVGYAAMSMDAVAARARSSKATIYRRWPGKPELVFAAVRAHTAHRAAEPPDTGELREDVRELLRTMRDGLVGQDATLVLGLMTAMRDDPELAGAVRSEIIDTKRSAFGTIVRRALARGEIGASPDPDLVAEVGSALVFSRVFVTGDPVDEAFVDRLTDDVVLPLLRAPREGEPA